MKQNKNQPDCCCHKNVAILWAGFINNSLSSKIKWKCTSRIEKHLRCHLVRIQNIYVIAHEKRDLLKFTLFHSFTPIGSSGYDDCNGTSRKRMRSSTAKVHPRMCVPPAKHCAKMRLIGDNHCQVSISVYYTWLRLCTNSRDVWQCPPLVEMTISDIFCFLAPFQCHPNKWNVRSRW